MPDRRHNIEGKSLFFFFTGVYWNTDVPSRASVVHNTYKWPSSENKFYIRTNTICW